MKYDRFHGKLTEADSTTMSSLLTTELELSAAAVLLIYMALRVLWSPLPALATALAAGYAAHKSLLSFRAFTENSDRIQVLLFYFIVMLTLIILLVGWRP